MAVPWKVLPRKKKIGLSEQPKFFFAAVVMLTLMCAFSQLRSFWMRLDDMEKCEFMRIFLSEKMKYVGSECKSTIYRHIGIDIRFFSFIIYSRKLLGGGTIAGESEFDIPLRFGIPYRYGGSGCVQRHPYFRYCWLAGSCSSGKP